MSASSPPAHAIRMSPKRSAWSSSTKPCLYNSSTARKRTITSSRSTCVGGQPGERDPAGARQLVDELGNGLRDAGAHRVDMEQVDRGLGRGVSARWPPRARARGVTPRADPAARPAKRSSGPTPRGTCARRRRPAAEHPATSLNVLHSSRRASRRSRSSQSASSSSRSPSARQGAGVGAWLDQRGRDEHEFGGDVRGRGTACARSPPGRRRRCGPGRPRRCRPPPRGSAVTTGRTALRTSGRAARLRHRSPSRDKLATRRSPPWDPSECCVVRVSDADAGHSTLQWTPTHGWVPCWVVTWFCRASSQRATSRPRELPRGAPCRGPSTSTGTTPSTGSSTSTRGP